MFTIHPISQTIIIGSSTEMSIQTADLVMRHVAKQHDYPRCQQQVASGYFMIIVDGQILLKDDRNRTNIDHPSTDRVPTVVYEWDTPALVVLTLVMGLKLASFLFHLC
jgi:hypothetical protein